MLELNNYMELIVDELMGKVLKSYDGVCGNEVCIGELCEEEICKLDIKAIALNNLKPLYYVRREGEVYNKAKMLEAQFKLSIIQEIVRAIEIVKKNPRQY